MDVFMQRAWDETTGTVGDCRPQKWEPVHFNVICAAGFFADRESECKRMDIDAVCTGAQISVDQVAMNVSTLYAGNSKKTALVAAMRETAELTVTVGPPARASKMNVVLVPLNGRIIIPQIDAAGTFKKSLIETGGFGVYIEMYDGSSVCSLPSTLKLECADHYDDKGAQCVPRPDETAANVPGMH